MWLRPISRGPQNKSEWEIESIRSLHKENLSSQESMPEFRFGLQILWGTGCLFFKARAVPDTIRAHSHLVVGSVGKGVSDDADVRAWHDPAEMEAHLSGKMQGAHYEKK